MRLALILALAWLAACGDDSLRDRRLAARLKAESKEESVATALAQPQRHAPRTKGISVIGLVPDPLAHTYDDAARIVLRFDEIATLARESAPHLNHLREVLPSLGLPSTSVEDTLRTLCGLPAGLPIDPARPFAIVILDDGWAVVLPAHVGEGEADGRIKPIDALYAVAGEPRVVKSYRPGFRKGFYLPGDCSVIAKPDAFFDLGSSLTRLTSAFGMDLSCLDGMLDVWPADIERVDISCRFGASALRVDVRAAPGRDTPTAYFLDKLQPSASSAARWLPAGGSLYGDLSAPARDFEGLAAHLLRDGLPEPGSEEEKDLRAWVALAGALGEDAAWMLHLTPEGSGYAVLVAQLDEPDRTTAFFGSDPDHLQRILKRLAGPGGRLEWTPDAFERHGAKVGSVTGHLDRDRLLSWRKRGDGIRATLSMLLDGPVFVYAAVAGDKLCIVAGDDSRAVAERVLDRIQSGSPADTDHMREVATIFPQRLASCSADLAALFDGCREAARYWHPEGAALRDFALRWRVPVAAAVTVEGGALRFALRVRPREFVEAFARIRGALGYPDSRD